jgi:para-aminobenzoate synthetase/4-amino-4-deoxychorismate lyase
MSSRRALHPLPLADIAPLLEGCMPVILLDSARPLPTQRHTLLFREPIEELTANTFAEIPELLGRLDRLSRKHWLCGYLSYEAGYALEPRFARLRRDPQPNAFPLGWFGVFGAPHVFDHATGRWNTVPVCQPRAAAAAVAPRLMPSLDRASYLGRIDTIRDYIAQGDTYQVNFTYDNLLTSTLEPAALYTALRAGQPTPLCAFIAHRWGHILSFAPELFFQQNRRTIVTQPMKGTAPRGAGAEEDAALRQGLAQDPKNRAENIMIVDMLRNDLGRICETNSIQVRDLFAVQTHPTLHQMTSTVTGTLRRQTGYADIFRGLFPCGSVTGAPKIRTMEIIAELESAPRGVYCGAIGYIAPGRRAVFSVPIRTLQKATAEAYWHYPVGSGIVWDSSGPAEWDECQTKCTFLTRTRPRFELIETMPLQNGRLLYQRDHLARMQRSAGHFNIPWDSRVLRQALSDIRRDCPMPAKHRIRLLLGIEGRLRWESALLTEAQSQEPGILLVASERQDPGNEFLYHKTTHRPWYATAMERIRAGACAEVCFLNTRNEITEGAISNIFILRDGALITPPVSCGLLPGVLRQRLLRTGRCREKILTLEDLRTAERVYCGNSVRGLKEVRLKD